MKTVGKRIISWLLAGIIALALIPFMSQTVRADGETPIALTDCKTIGFDYDFSDDGCPMYYINIGEANTTILLSDFDEDSDISKLYGTGVRIIYHQGKNFIGSYGRSFGDENLMFYNPDKDVCIVILTSSNMKKDGTPDIDELMWNIYDVL